MPRWRQNRRQLGGRGASCRHRALGCSQEHLYKASGSLEASRCHQYLIPGRPSAEVAYLGVLARCVTPRGSAGSHSSTLASAATTR